MKPIQDVFLETEWGDEGAARQARDARAAELQAQGLICNCENLYTVDGYRVFLVESTEAELEDVSSSKQNRHNASSKKLDRPVRKSPPPLPPRKDVVETGEEHPPNLYRKRRRVEG
jgi:hypothetical protein